MIDSLLISFRNSQDQNRTTPEVSETSNSAGVLGAPESAASPAQTDIHLALARDEVRRLQEVVEKLKISRRNMQKRIYELEAALRNSRETSTENHTEIADKQVALSRMSRYESLRAKSGRTQLARKLGNAILEPIAMQSPF